MENLLHYSKRYNVHIDKCRKSAFLRLCQKQAKKVMFPEKDNLETFRC